jgi:7-alpha-hydroxysteroid dehydrogenase
MTPSNHAGGSPQGAPLDGAVALVTGAGRGIGAAIAGRFAEEGATLVLVARTREDLDWVAGRIQAGGGAAEVVVADLAAPAAAAAIVERAGARFGRLDLLVNNAGGAAPAAFEETTGAELEAAFRLNVVTAFELTRQATPLLLQSDRAGVVNVSSRMDRLVSRGLLTYGTVKAALTHMTRLLAIELAPRVRVNAISPGVVATEALEQALDADSRAQIEATTPLHRLASVDDVADAAAWLVSAQASYVTGKVIELDGGAEWPVFPNDSPDLKPPRD